MWMIIVIAVLVLFFLFEYRLRKPDQIILEEKEGKIINRKSRLYPKHFCLVLPKTIYSMQQIIEATAKGNLDIKIKLGTTVALSMNNINELIKTGGWNSNAVSKAAKEFETVLHSYVKEFTEKFEVEELSSEKIINYLNEKNSNEEKKYGLEVVSISIHSFELMDNLIAEAIKQQESARILEQTELLNQQARITSAKAKLKADEEIANLENQLELRKYELKQSELEKESLLAQSRAIDELKRKRMHLEYEKEELSLLKNNPELLMLSPQAARLAEAGQSLKNARTIVSLNPSELAPASELAGMFQQFLINSVNSGAAKSDENK